MNLHLYQMNMKVLSIGKRIYLSKSIESIKRKSKRIKKSLKERFNLVVLILAQILSQNSIVNSKNWCMMAEIAKWEIILSCPTITCKTTTEAHKCLIAHHAKIWWCSLAILSTHPTKAHFILFRTNSKCSNSSNS